MKIQFLTTIQPCLDDIHRTGYKSCSDSGQEGADKVTRNSIYHVLTGDQTIFDSVVDDSLTHVYDAVAANVRQRPPVQSAYHPLLPLDSQVGIQHSLDVGDS